MSTQPGILHIDRANDFVLDPKFKLEHQITFELFLDGQFLTAIEALSTKSYSVEPGTHRLQVRRSVIRRQGNAKIEEDSAEIRIKIKAREWRRVMCSHILGVLSIQDITEVALTDEPIPNPSSPVSEQSTEAAPAVAFQGSSRNIFISYRRSDSADISGRIYDRLVAKFGKEQVFKDVDSIPLGSNFKAVLDSSVGACKVLLAIIGRDWVTAKDANGKLRLQQSADFVRLEVESALNRDIPVVPLLVGGATMPKAGELPKSLRELTYRNGIAIRPDPDFHNDMNRLISSLESLLK